MPEIIHDVVGIGNAIVDIIGRCKEDFLARHGAPKGRMRLVDAGIAKRQTASVYLGKLVELGLLTPIQSGREKLFVHRALLDLLAADSAAVPAYRGKK